MKVQNKKRIALIVALSGTIMVLAGLFVFAGIQAYSDNIYPNISAYGIELGGLSEEDAVEAILDASPYRYADTSVTVEFPFDITLTIEAEAAGLLDYPADVAQEVSDYGKTGGFIRNAISYISCMMTPRSLFNEVNFTIDAEYIKGRIEETAEKVRSKATETTVEIKKEAIEVTKGTGEIKLDTEYIYNAIYNAFYEKKFETIKYTPEYEYEYEIDLAELEGKIHKEPVAAEMGEDFTATQEINGRTFDIEAAAEQIAAAAAGDTVIIEYTELKPEATKEELEGMIFRDILAQTTTELVYNETRSTNAELACNMINGLIMMPGEEFSFNGTVGQRTIEKGYGYATAYIGGRAVPAVGGGICQTSSTLYYACLLANLEIVYRTCHMYPSDYVPLGMDATVSWGGPDYQFRNNTEYPIKLEMWRDGGTINAIIYGTKTDDTYVEMSYEITGWISAGTIYREDPSIAPGEKQLYSSGSAGAYVETYRSVYSGDGTLISRTYEDYSDYSGYAEIYLVAPADAQGSVTEGTEATETAGVAVEEVAAETSVPADGNTEETQSPEAPSE